MNEKPVKVLIIIISFSCLIEFPVCVSEAAHSPPLLPERVTRSRNTAEALQLALNYLLSRGGLITRSAVRKSPISPATYAHAHGLMATESRCDIFMNQSA